MKNVIFTILFLSIFIGNLFCQHEKTQNWSVEIGGIYNQWYPIYDLNNQTDTILYGRWTKFRVMPSLRINRQFQVTEAFYLKPFIGAAVNGTQTDIPFTPQTIDSVNLLPPNNFEPPTSLAYYYMPQIEIGTFADFAFKKSNLQLGLKAQYHLTLWTNHVRMIFPDEPFTLNDLMNAEYRKYTLDNSFRRFNMSLGIRYQYNLQRFLIAFEGWYGMRDITPSNPSNIETKIHTTNLRLMFGYKF